MCLDFGFRVSSLGFRVWGVGFWVLVFLWILGSEVRGCGFGGSIAKAAINVSSNKFQVRGGEWNAAVPDIVGNHM